jgi:hypothetical protein
MCNESLCPSPQLSFYCMYNTENKYDHRILLKNLHYTVQKVLIIMPINTNNTSISQHKHKIITVFLGL